MVEKKGVELYPWQLAALPKIKNGTVLCGGTGSGKSITGLAYYWVSQGGVLAEIDYTPVNGFLDLYIITTARKRDSKEWNKELDRYGLLDRLDVNVVIDSWNNIKKYKDVRGAFFIFDEQHVGGSGTWAKQFVSITRSNKWILLSATPGDTWSDYISIFVAHGFFKNKSEFYRKHVVLKPYMNFPVIDHYTDEEYLQFLVSEVLVTMKYQKYKETVPHDYYIPVQYDRLKYKEIVKSRFNPDRQEPFQGASDYCAYLRKLVNIDESRSVELLKILDDHPKVIIFYSFDYELEILRNLVYPQGTVVAEWNGHKHEPVPDCDSWVYLAQYIANAEAWECTSTDTMIFYSQTYSYRMLIQCKGRIDRSTTAYKDLFYYHLVSSAPIDLSIKRALASKRNFNERRFYGK